MVDRARCDDLDMVRVPLTHPDALRLVEDVQQVYLERYGSRDEAPVDFSEFDDPHGMFFVGYSDGVAVATGAWRRHEPPPGIGGPCAEIKRMYVAQAYRRRGFARAMLDRVEETARAEQIASLVLETGLLQPEAISLYLSSGYVEIDKFGYHRDQELSRCFAKVL